MIREPRNLWESMVGVEKAQEIKLKRAKSELKELKTELRRRTKEDTGHAVIEDVSKKAYDLNFKIESKRGMKSLRVLKKQFKEIERFSKKHLPGLQRLNLEHDILKIKKFETELFIMNMRFDALKLLHEKSCN